MIIFSLINQDYYFNVLNILGAHKGLFSRHALNKEKAVYTTKLKPMSVQRINFDDSELYNTSSDKQSVSQQRIRTPTKIKSTFKNVNKYSRIFSTRKPNDNRGKKKIFLSMHITVLNYYVYTYLFF